MKALALIALSLLLLVGATRGAGLREAEREAGNRPSPVPAPVAPVAPVATPEQMAAFITELRNKHLLVPISGANPESVKGSFYQGRAERMHRAADFMAERGTPIMAVDDGPIRRLFNSKNGGITIYQMDMSGRFVYYYAHLDSYAAGLTVGTVARKGQVIGYVGSTGDAKPESPHLHFAIWQTDPTHIWDGIAIDPYEVFKGSATKRKGSIPTKGGVWI